MVLQWYRKQLRKEDSWRRAALRRWRGYRPRLESLEERVVPANTPFAPLIPWVSQGPGPIQFGQTEGLTGQNNPVVGAVDSLAVDPTNPDHIIAGTVNGGIWVTFNGTSSNPSWAPKTDHLVINPFTQQLGSLAISSVAFDPGGPNSVWAGTGNLSNSGTGASFSPGVVGDGGGNTGLYHSIDGGLTWLTLGNTANQFRSFRVAQVLPTGVISGSTEIILAAFLDSGGLWRSTDGGVTFTQISGGSGTGLPAGSVTSLAQEPGPIPAGPARIYA